MEQVCKFLLKIWQPYLPQDIDINDNIFLHGIDQKACSLLLDILQNKLQDYFYTPGLYSFPTIRSFADYLCCHYPQTIARKFFNVHDFTVISPQISPYHLQKLQHLTSPVVSNDDTSCDSPIVFILCAPRSGSTLLRSMLGGHSQLFSPPELNLLLFSSMKHYNKVCHGMNHHLKEGVIRAIMHIKSYSVEQSISFLESCSDMSIVDFYHLLQLQKKIVVDKSTAYAFSYQTLQRMQRLFPNAYYIHLVREPKSAIASFRNVRFDRLLFGGKHYFSQGELAELSWLCTNRNIHNFLKTVPDKHRIQLHYQDLATQPRQAMEKICSFLQISFGQGMLQPYTNIEEKMLDGIYSRARSQGDPRFYAHSTIEFYKHKDDKITLSPLTTEFLKELPYYKRNVKASKKCASENLWQLFAQQAQECPHALAIFAKHKSMTYSQLYKESQSLAMHLPKKSCRIGVFIDRSPSAIVALLAILQLGHTYVPLDPQYPQLRLQHMIEDARLQCIITLPQDTASISFPNVVIMDKCNHPTGEEIQLPKIDKHQAAYILYTSGSSGKPKGVIVHHQAAVNAIIAQINIFSVTPKSRILQLASFNFDTSIVQIFTALGSGACLHIASPDNLVNFCRQYKITHADIMPAILNQMKKESLPDLQVISSGGEKNLFATIERWSNEHKYFNAYGTTETAICSTLMPYRAGLPKWLSIGFPKPGVFVYILDNNLQPVLSNNKGNIYISGIGVGKGYVSATSAQQNFMSDIFQPQFTMYRTGDCGRYLEDGSIQFCGRNDQQIQLRGLRIEPGEIESTLTKIAEVQQAIVIVKNYHGQPHLFAYVNTKSSIEKARLHQHLQEFLPQHMLPKIIFIEKFPLTPSGKIDIQALPDIDFFTRVDNVDGKTEKLLADAWKKVLSVAHVSREQNFFDLGGNSLNIIQLYEILQQAFHQLTLVDLFHYTTIKYQAKFLTSLSNNNDNDIQIRIHKKRQKLLSRKKKEQR